MGESASFDGIRDRFMTMMRRRQEDDDAEEEAMLARRKDPQGLWSRLQAAVADADARREVVLADYDAVLRAHVTGALLARAGAGHHSWAMDRNVDSTDAIFPVEYLASLKSLEREWCEDATAELLLAFLQDEGIVIEVNEETEASTIKWV